MKRMFVWVFLINVVLGLIVSRRMRAPEPEDTDLFDDRRSVPNLSKELSGETTDTPSVDDPEPKQSEGTIPAGWASATGPNLIERVEELRRMSKTQPDAARAAGLRYLDEVLQRPAPESWTVEGAVVNEVLKTLVTAPGLTEGLASRLQDLVHGSAVPLVVRDYALQFSGTYYDRLQRETLGATGTQEKEASLAWNTLWSTLVESEEQLSGTAMVNLAHLASSFSEAEAEQFEGFVLELIENPDAKASRRATGLSVGLLMDYPEARALAPTADGSGPRSGLLPMALAPFPNPNTQPREDIVVSDSIPF